MTPPPSIDAYIATFPPDVQDVLQRIRRVVRDAAPDTSEVITYGIPTLVLGERHLIYFAGWKRHISIYPIPAADAALRKAMAPYESGKGTLKFPLREPIPYELIGRIAEAARKSRG